MAYAVDKHGYPDREKLGIEVKRFMMALDELIMLANFVPPPVKKALYDKLQETAEAVSRNERKPLHHNVDIDPGVYTGFYNKR